VEAIKGFCPRDCGLPNIDTTVLDLRDMNGDGYPDRILMDGLGTPWLCRGTGSGFLPCEEFGPEPEPPDRFPVLPGEPLWDGTDLVDGFLQEPLEVFSVRLAATDAYNDNPGQGTHQLGYGALRDLNGDGLPDLVYTAEHLPVDFAESYGTSPGRMPDSSGPRARETVSCRGGPTKGPSPTSPMPRPPRTSPRETRSRPSAPSSTCST